MKLNNMGCLDNNDCDELVITDVINNGSQKIVISPNPSTGIININRAYKSIKYIHILNTKGQYIDEIYPLNNILDLSHLPNGMYFLNFKSANGSNTVVRIVLSR